MIEAIFVGAWMTLPLSIIVDGIDILEPNFPRVEQFFCVEGSLSFFPELAQGGF